jgi:hypothetical protein
MTMLKWELIKTDPSDRSDIETWRAEVPGGWLVSVWATRDRANATGTARPGGSNWGGGVTFVPDEKHEWKVGDDEATPTRGRG